MAKPDRLETLVINGPFDLERLTFDPPATPGVERLYARTDGTIYQRSPSGAITDISAGGGGGSDTPRQELITTENIVGADQALVDTLDFTPVSAASVVLFLNGLKLDQGAGKEYTISGTTITWLASSGYAADLSTLDVLTAFYLS